MPLAIDGSGVDEEVDLPHMLGALRTTELTARAVPWDARDVGRNSRRLYMSGALGKPPMTIGRSDRTRDPRTVGRDLRRDGWSFLPGSAVSPIGDTSGWAEIRSAWTNLPPDPYSGGVVGRFRRYGRWSWDGGAGTSARRGVLAASAHRPYYQSRSVNSLAGGVHRLFAPLPCSVRDSQALRELLLFDLIAAGAGRGRWNVDVHMIRIVPSVEGPGLPVPEGVHRDGLDVAVIHLVDSVGLFGGTTSVYDDAGIELYRVRLRDPMDALVIDDRRLRHYTSPVHRLDISQAVAARCRVGTRDTRESRLSAIASAPAWRDVLLVGIQREGAQEDP